MLKAEIISLHREGKSFREIARIKGVDRKTVAKYVKEFLVLEDILRNKECDKAFIQEQIFQKPMYKSRTKKMRKWTEEMDHALDLILKNEKQKVRVLGNTHKQKLTNTQIHEEMVAQGFKISLSTVGLRLKEKRGKLKECFIRQSYDFGQRLEYDFGEVKLQIRGETQKFHLAVLSSPASQFRWAYLYKSQKMEVFLDSHVKFFEMLGGVHQEIVYDNMRNVVKKFIGKNEKILNENLLNLSNYYGFHINVTNCYKGNEKGYVEGSVKKIRNFVFAKNYQFESFESAQDFLENKLQELNSTSTIQEETMHLLPKPPKLELSELHERKVDHYGFIKLKKANYSVPEEYIGKVVLVRKYVDKLKIYHDERLLCEHKRKDGAGVYNVEINHYLQTLYKKPGALPNSEALKSKPALHSLFDTYYTKEPRFFIQVLMENKGKSEEELCRILQPRSKANNSIKRKENVVSFDFKTKQIIDSYANLRIGGNKA